jgi:hypothetical protein
MSVLLEIYLTEKQALIVRQNLALTINSMRTLLVDLNRENGRWHSKETDALLAQDQDEIAALQYVVDELDKFKKAHGWEDADGQSDAQAAAQIEIDSNLSGSSECLTTATA